MIANKLDKISERTMKLLLNVLLRIFDWCRCKIKVIKLFFHHLGYFFEICLWFHRY